METSRSADSNLTPIRVRGKRQKNPRSTGENAVQIGQTGSIDSVQSSRPSKKPGKRPLSSPEKSRVRQARRVKLGRRRMSSLESLPVELIEKIFLYSLEVNFPLASPRFGAMLSREPIYKILTFIAYYNDHVDPGDELTRSYLRSRLGPWEYVETSSSLRQTLQSIIPLFKWFTLDRLKDSLRLMTKLAIHKHLFGPRPNGAAMVMDAARFTEVSKHLDKDPRAWETTVEGVDKYNKHCTAHIFAKSLEIGYFNGPRDKYHKRMSISPMVVWNVPDNLLRGNGTPWTDKKFALLQFLLYFLPTGFVATEESVKYLPSLETHVSHDALQEGIHNAITQQNILILCELLAWDERINCRWKLPDPPDPSSLGTPDILEEFDFDTFLGYGRDLEVQPEHFLTAIRQSEDPRLVQVLLRASAESIPCDDDEVTAWAMRLRDSGNDDNAAFGQWLLSFMVDVPTRKGTMGTLFYFGWTKRVFHPVSQWRWEYKRVPWLRGLDKFLEEEGLYQGHVGYQSQGGGQLMHARYQ
ncbi:hypothetical protein FQN55_003326 [Onygenales sp. PD_40]|nr:hypothetical protein FQN55_003326 [Onygenales sp. PD_40]